MKKEQEEQFSPFGSYERYTPKLKLPGVIEKKQVKKQFAVKKQELSKRDKILIVLIITSVSVTLYFIFNSNEGKATVLYEKSTSWIIESSKCNPQDLELKIRNFEDQAVSEGEWIVGIKGSEYTIVLEEKITKGSLKTLIFYFESNIMQEGTNRFRLYSPDFEYYDGECTI